MRRPLKRLIESALVAGGACRLGRRVHRQDSLILAFHNVIPDDAPSVGDQSLHLARSRFLAFVDHLEEHHAVVALPDLLQPVVAEGGSRRPRVAITFDDAYRGAVTIAVEDLAMRGLPATVFVSPALLEDRVLWWDLCAGQLQGRDFDRFRSRALDEFRGEDDRVRASAAELGNGEIAIPGYARTATVEELQRAVRHDGIALGSHTWSHPNLARLERTEVSRELAEPMVWLRERFESVIPWLAYPYGLASDGVISAAAEAAYEAAVLTTGGWQDLTAVNRFALPRLNVPASLSVRGFMLLASGL